MVKLGGPTARQPNSPTAQHALRYDLFGVEAVLGHTGCYNWEPLFGPLVAQGPHVCTFFSVAGRPNGNHPVWGGGGSV